MAKSSTMDAKMRPPVWMIGGALVAIWTWTSVAQVDELSSSTSTTSLVSQVRRPVDAVLLPSGKLVVANERSGSVSVIDTQSRAVLVESDVGSAPSAIAVVPGTNTLLLTDQAAKQLILATLDGEALRVIERIDLPTAPGDVAVTQDGGWAAVTCLWSRRVVTFALSADAGDGSVALTKVHEHELTFEPRLVLAISDRQFLVADAFGGELAVVDVATGALRETPGVKGHNIAGLAMSSDGADLHLSHQFVNPLASANRDDVLWGALMENMTHTLAIDDVLAATVDDPVPLTGDIVRLGEVGRGAGDPAGFAIYTDEAGVERRIIALAGVNEVLVESAFGSRRLAVGVCPTHVVVNDAAREAYVINSLDDSVSVVDLLHLEVTQTISLGPRPPLTPADRGERLFRDAGLSLDGWLSCQSCHPNGHTNGLLADTANDGSYLTPKAIPSLLGTRDANPWAWNGSFRELHQQVRQSVASTMQGENLSAAQEIDIVAFLHTMRPPPPLEPPRPGEDSEQVLRGEAVFRRAGCAACHVPPLTYTSDQVYDVGLTDEAGLMKFNPPTLRGVSHRRRFFHDHRAGSLEEVLVEHDHGAHGLSDEELRDLFRFLGSL